MEIPGLLINSLNFMTMHNIVGFFCEVFHGFTDMGSMTKKSFCE